MNEERDLNKLAEEELLREAQRGASRAAVGGALAWQKCPLQPTNKRFLFNVIRHTVKANKVKDDSQRLKSDKSKHRSSYPANRKRTLSSSSKTKRDMHRTKKSDRKSRSDSSARQERNLPYASETNKKRTRIALYTK